MLTGTDFEKAQESLGWLRPTDSQDALFCLLWSIVPVLRQAYIALDKPEPIKLDVLLKYACSVRAEKGKVGIFFNATE